MAISDYPGDLPQLKRRQEIIGQGGAPAGIGLTPEQVKAQRDAEWRKGSIQRQQQFKQGMSDAIGTAAGSIASIPMGIGKALANANVYDRPFDYSTPAKEAAKPGTTPRQQAGGIMAFDIAQRAVDSAQRPFGIPRSMLTQAVPAAPGITKTSSAAKEEQLETPVTSGRVQSGGAGGQASANVADNGWTSTGIGAGRSGGEIVGRIGANGIPEFSNDTIAQQGAGPQRTIDRVGNGIGGGITFGEDGDSQLAIDRFERANAERAKTISMLKQYEPSGIAGNRGPMTLDEVLQTRLELRQREADFADRELRQRGIDSGMDRALRERELAGVEQRNQLEGQRTQQEIEAGDMSLAQQRRVEELSARIADPATDAAERESLLRTYSQLTGKKLDSGTIKLKRASTDPLTGAKTEEEYLADARTGRPLVDQGGQGSVAISSDQKAIAIRDNPQLTREQKVAQLKALGYN